MARKPGSAIARAIILDVCKDGTLSYRLPNQPRLNTTPNASRRSRDSAGALPVFSVDTMEQVQSFQVTFCRLQYMRHPLQPERPWYKLSKLGDGTDPAFSRPDGLTVEDLDGIQRMFQEHWDKYHAPKQEQAS